MPGCGPPGIRRVEASILFVPTVGQEKKMPNYFILNKIKSPQEQPLLQTPVIAPDLGRDGRKSALTFAKLTEGSPAVIHSSRSGRAGGARERPDFRALGPLVA